MTRSASTREPSSNTNPVGEKREISRPDLTVILRTVSNMQKAKGKLYDAAKAYLSGCDELDATSINIKSSWNANEKNQRRMVNAQINSPRRTRRRCRKLSSGPGRR